MSIGGLSPPGKRVDAKAFEVRFLPSPPWKSMSTTGTSSRTFPTGSRRRSIGSARSARSSGTPSPVFFVAIGTDHRRFFRTVASRRSVESSPWCDSKDEVRAGRFGSRAAITWRTPANGSQRALNTRGHRKVWSSILLSSASPRNNAGSPVEDSIRSLGVRVGSTPAAAVLREETRKMKCQWWHTGLENRGSRKRQWFDSTFFRWKAKSRRSRRPTANRVSRKAAGSTPASSAVRPCGRIPPS